jgi:ATP-binding cassette, subfamily B, bacterial
VTAALDAIVPADLRRLLRSSGGRRDLVLGLVLMFLSAWGLVAAPWLIGKAVNDLQRGSTDSLLEVSLGVAAAGLVTAVSTGAATWLLGRYAVTLALRIRELVHERLLSASLDLYRTHPTGQLVARTTADVEPIQLFITSGASVLTQLLGSLAFVIVVMFLMDPALAAIALTPFPIAVLVQIRYAARTREATAAAEQSRGEVAAMASDNVRGAKLILSLGRETEQRSAFGRAVEMLFAGWVRVGRLDAGYGAVLGALPYIGLGLVLAFGGRAVIDGRISLGEFVTFYSYGGMLAAAAGQITYLTYVTAGAAGSADRIAEVIDHPYERFRDDGSSVPAGNGPDVGLRDVLVAHGAEPLHGLSLDLRRGETVALVGATGAGTATVLDLVNGLVAPDEGVLSLDDRPLPENELPLLRRLSAPAGEGRLFALSIADNIAYGRPDATRAEIEAAAQLAHAHEIAERMPAGYETNVGEDGGQLSGGERQRVALARALLVERPVLLLDDATSALDPQATNGVLDGIVRAGASSRLLTTHAEAALTLADRIVVLDAGRVIGMGPHTELLETCPEYRRMVELWSQA